MPPPQRPKPARKGARCGVGDGSPLPHPPHPQPVGSRPRPHARKDEPSGVGERPTPDAPHPGKRRPPRGTLMPPPQRAKPARKSARCGVGDRFPHPHPPHPQPVGSGPRQHVRKHEWLGVGDCPTPDAPHPGKRRRPRAPSCRPHSAPSQRARARADGSVMGPHARTPRTHSLWVVGPSRKPERTSGRGRESARPWTPHTEARGAPPWPHAPKDGRSGTGERPTPDAQATGAPFRAASCRPHGVKSQLARARAMGLVRGPHARTPRDHRQWVVGPSRTAEKRSGRGWESAQPRTPRQPAPPPGHPHAAPTARRASSQERARWGW